MALTDTQQRRLEELQRRRQVAPQSMQVQTPATQQPGVVQPQTGLSPAKQARFNELAARRQTQQTQVVQQEINQEKVNQLLKQLGGELPLTPEQQRGVFQPTAKTIRQEAGNVQQRQSAFNQLLQMGLSRQQIELSLRTQKALGRPKIGRPVGGIAGAIGTTMIAGRLIPGPFDDAAILAGLIAAGGAGAGGVIGEQVQTGIEERRLISKREALSAFANESLTELGGRAAVRGGKFLFSPFIRKTVPEAASLVDDFAKAGGNFSPTELDRRFSLRVGEAFSRGGFGAKEIFQEFEEKQGKAVLVFADNIIDSIGEGVARETPEQIGSLLASDITRPGGRMFNILDDLFDPLFKQIDELGKRATVSTKGLKTFAQKHLATDSRLNKQFLSPAGRSKLQKILGLGDELSFSDMRTLRSSFLKDVRKMARDVDQSQGLIKQLAGVADDAIFDPKAAVGLNPEALNLLRNTNSLYKASQTALKEVLPESLAKRLLRNPSSVVKQVFPNNNPKAIKSLRQALIEPVSGRPSAEGKILWNQLRQAWLADAVDKASVKGVANPVVLDNIFRKLGPAGFKEMFPEKQVASKVKKIPLLFQTAGKAPPVGVSIFARGVQFGGLAMMWQGAKEGNFIGFTAGGILAVGPLAFAKLATTPQGVKFLTAGFKLKPGASGLVPNAVRMIRLLREIERKEQKPKRNIVRPSAIQQQLRRGL